MTDAQTTYIETLVNGVPAWLGELPGPVWAVHVNRTYEDPFWPIVRFETTEERERRLVTQAESILLPDPIHVFPIASLTEQRDAEPSPEDAEVIFSLMEALGDPADSGPLLTVVAQRLNANPGVFAFERAPDFVVYGCWSDGDDLRSELEASIPSERLSDFRDRGWM